MAVSSIVVLPAIAVILALQGTWLDNGTAGRGQSKKPQRKAKAKVLIHRALIITLLVATLIVFKSSLTVLPDIVQGFVVTAILMLPVLIYLFFTYLLTLVSSALVKTTPSTIDTFRQTELQYVAQVPQSNASSSIREQDMSKSAIQTRAIETLDGQENDLSSEVTSSVFDQTLSVDSQMRNIDSAMDHLDIGADKVSGSSNNRAPHGNLNELETRQRTLEAAQDMFESDLAALRTVRQDTVPATSSGGDLPEMISSLQKDNIKLQKLVIAQKAVIETEKRRTKRAKVLTQDALTVMRRAREQAGVSIRVTRSERRERLRLEADNAKVRKRLENATSAQRVIQHVNV